MIPRLKRQTKKRHSVARVYHWMLSFHVVEPIICAPITPDVFGSGFFVTGTPPSPATYHQSRSHT